LSRNLVGISIPGSNHPMSDHLGGEGKGKTPGRRKGTWTRIGQGGVAARENTQSFLAIRLNFGGRKNMGGIVRRCKAHRSEAERRGTKTKV